MNRAIGLILVPTAYVIAEDVEGRSSGPTARVSPLKSPSRHRRSERL